MLKETYPGKDSEGRRRRWFADDYFDLIVWMDTDEEISGFQLCYDKSTMERAVTWKRGSGFTHQRVDDGEADPAKNSTPILVPDGACPIQELIRIFTERSADMDEAVRSMILHELKEYAVICPILDVHRARR